MTVALAMAGWYVNNNSANFRETRKEVRSDVSEINACVSSIVNQIEDYFLADVESDEDYKSFDEAERLRFERVRLQVHVAFKSLDMRVERLGERMRGDGGKLLDLRDVVIRSSEFFDVATGDGLRRVDLQDDSAMQECYQFVSRVHVSAAVLVDVLDRSVIKAFQ